MCKQSLGCEHVMMTSKPLLAIFHRDRVDAEETVPQKQSQVTPGVAYQAVGVVHVVLGVNSIESQQTFQ